MDWVVKYKPRHRGDKTEDCQLEYPYHLNGLTVSNPDSLRVTYAQCFSYVLII